MDSAAGHGQREQVYCYNCSHSWYNDEWGHEACPRCENTFVQIIEDPNDDPRADALPHEDDASDNPPDPPEDDIDMHNTGPNPAQPPNPLGSVIADALGSLFGGIAAQGGPQSPANQSQQQQTGPQREHDRTTYFSSRGHGQPPVTDVHQGNGGSIFGNMFGGRSQQPGNRPHEPGRPQVHVWTETSRNGYGGTFTMYSSNTGRMHIDRAGPPQMPFPDMFGGMGHPQNFQFPGPPFGIPPPNRPQRETGPGVGMGPFGPMPFMPFGPGSGREMPGHGHGPMPGPGFGGPGFGGPGFGAPGFGGPGFGGAGGASGHANPADQFMQMVTSLMLQHAGAQNPHAFGGDAVFSDEAVDRIAQALMDQQNPNRPHPASEAAMAKIRKVRAGPRELSGSGDKSVAEKGECSICMGDVFAGETVSVLSCTHWFHNECITQWLGTSGTCPICRKPVTENDDYDNEHNSSGDGGGGAPRHGSGSSTDGNGHGGDNSSSSGRRSSRTMPSSPFSSRRSNAANRTRGGSANERPEGSGRGLLNSVLGAFSSRRDADHHGQNGQQGRRGP